MKKKNKEETYPNLEFVLEAGEESKTPSPRLDSSKGKEGPRHSTFLTSFCA